jgi:hypothetical protein
MNPHTGASEKTKASTDEYRDGWDLIWGKRIVKQPVDNRFPKDPPGCPHRATTAIVVSEGFYLRCDDCGMKRDWITREWK